MRTKTPSQQSNGPIAGVRVFVGWGGTLPPLHPTTDSRETSPADRVSPHIRVDNSICRHAARANGRGLCPGSDGSGITAGITGVPIAGVCGFPAGGVTVNELAADCPKGYAIDYSPHEGAGHEHRKT
jgi:hypothetical protein